MRRHALARLGARLGAAAAALAVCGATWAAFAPAASAVSGIQTGYWSNLPAAPQVPAGGLEVASDASGPQAVAAVRFTLADGETSPVLTLKVAQAQPQSQLAIEACAIAAESSGWSAPAGGGPGAMGSAPKADCAGGLVAGAVAADGSTVTFDLAAIADGGAVVNVILQPNTVPSPTSGTVPGAPDNTYPNFDAAFKPVDASQITVQTTGASSAAPPPAAATSVGGGGAYAAPPPAGSSVALAPPAMSANPPAVAPVVASPQPTNAAASGPAMVTKKRNLRLLFGIGMLSSDLLFVLLWLDRRLPGPGERPMISIYDPPPLVS